MQEFICRNTHKKKINEAIWKIYKATSFFKELTPSFVFRPGKHFIDGPMLLTCSPLIDPLNHK